MCNWKNERFSPKAARMCAFSNGKQYVPPFSSPSNGEKGRTEAAPPEHADVTGAKQFRFPMTIKRRPERRAERSKIDTNQSEGGFSR